MSTQKIKEQDKLDKKEPVIVEPEIDKSCAACQINFDEPPEDTVPVSAGKVHNCQMLNVREKPNRTSKVLEIISNGSSVDVFITESTNDWYKVGTNEGVIGYCMKEYIKLV